MPSPQRVQWAKLRVLVVAVAALAILVVLVHLLSGGAWFTPKSTLRTYLPDSSGLEAGADVELHGVLIGKIESLRLTRSKDPNRAVEVRMEVQDDFRRHIPVDSVTGIESETLLGDQYINITMGRSSQPVPPGGELRFRAPSNIMQNIDLRQFAAQLKIIDRTIRDIQAGKGGLGVFINTDTMYRNSLAAVSGLEQNLRKATQVQSRLGQFLYSTETYEQIQAPFRQLDKRLADLQASPYLRDSAQYDRLRDQIERVRRALPKGRFFTSDEDYREWNRLAEGWIDAIDSLATGPLVGNASTYETWTGKLRNMESFLKEFREDPQKFLRIKVF
jgi:phospholipid/cholesterol/gamma-HCH transport system substrate-binding protein